MDNFCTPPKKWAGGLSTCSPWDSAQWNAVTLTPADLDIRYLDTMRLLCDRLASKSVSAAEVDSIALTFSIPCGLGTYNLIPNGRDIHVDASNLVEYVSRLEIEFDKWSAIFREREARGLQKQKLPDVLAGSPSDTSGILTAPDLLFLQAFAANASTMGQSVRANPHLLQQLGLRWSIEVPGKNVTLQLRPNGAELLVQPIEYDQYVQTVIDCVSEVSHSIALHRQFPVSSTVTSFYSPSQLTTGDILQTPSPIQSGQTVDESIRSGAPTRLREEVEAARSLYMRELAVPLTTRAADLELFSPTHDSFGLFSPPQQINW